MRYNVTSKMLKLSIHMCAVCMIIITKNLFYTIINIKKCKVNTIHECVCHILRKSNASVYIRNRKSNYTMYCA